MVLTPGLIYRQLGKRPSCGSCLPLITKLMVAYDEEGPSAAASVPHAAGRSRSPSLDAQEQAMIAFKG